ncbi:GNAT family N-acetyltransferase [Amycolatopsis aidingensis]|uniref:GNAT family N-acetyltransferase n=1 Tax=Amycolatopsis aidingensis TaxID=2842453 RepID=UPI001C0AF710|nr:GNAT family N-acetyltransferase [Amycolatopsis aidingensis]
MTITLRAAEEADHPALVRAVQQWWGDSRSPAQASELALLLPRLFLQHFASTSLIAEDDGHLAGFLVGFYSADDPAAAYIHFVGIDPGRRRAGLGRRLYETFFAAATVAGRQLVRAVTSPGNQGSIAFHRGMGFQLEPGDREVDGVPVRADYDGPGQDRVCFRLDLLAG